MRYSMSQKRQSIILIRMILILFLLAAQNLKAESQNVLSSQSSNIKGQVARIMMSGLGGAVFGVSTLSFYGKPQEHLSNVAIGSVVGLILGAVYVTNETWSDDLYSNNQQLQNGTDHFENIEFQKWSQNASRETTSSSQVPLYFSWHMSF